MDRNAPLPWYNRLPWWANLVIALFVIVLLCQIVIFAAFGLSS